MAEEKKPSTIGGFIVVIVFGVLMYSCIGGGESTQDASDRSAQEAIDKRKGFHCLSAWDGSHAPFKSDVKRRMRDPSSFEHIETRVTPVSSSGLHNVYMDYRAKNGFGGFTVGTATGVFNNSDCRHTVISVQ